MGESPANQETAITITGLKPSHFYNVRVIAVGGNGFQAISQALRLRTFGRDGRPELGNSRLPPNFDPDDHQPSSTQREHGDENGPPRSPIPGIESAPMPEISPALTRDPGVATTAPRRNTLGRKPSPSVGSIDHKPTRKDSTSADEIKELSDRFSSTKKELEDTVALIAKEEEDNKRLLDELEQEKQEKKSEQKKKEEQTEKLKKEERMTERAMRSALQRKTQIEKDLKLKQAERAKFEDGIAKMNKQTEDWHRETESFEEQKQAIEDEGKARMETLREAITQLQSENSRLENDLRTKREQVKKLEDERKKLPGGEGDEAWRDADKEKRHHWARRERDAYMRLCQEEKRTRELDVSLQSIHDQLARIPPAAFTMLNQANMPSAEFDAPSQNQLKRRSHHSNSMPNPTMSPAPLLAALETLPQSIGFSATRQPPGFASGPFGGLSAETDRIDEEGFRALAAGAPLSPSAHKLLPSNIFTDDEHDDPESPASEGDPQSPFVHRQTASPDRDPQSPDSGRSASILPSPYGSAQNLPFPSLPTDDSERQSLHSRHDTFPSPHPVPGQPAPHRLSSWFGFQRGRPSKAADEPPPLGSLKHGQSQSFPRQTDEPDTTTNRRKISLSGWGLNNRNSVGPDTMDTYAPQAGGTGGFWARNLPFGARAMTTVYDRDQTSPRPTSIASSDIPRPSTDSASLWPQETGAFSRPRRIWSSDNNSWSRAPSRRPSIHGSPSALKTTLANVDDEILDDDALMDPQVSPSQVGVIGSRSVTKKALAKTLNPNAPGFSPFIGNIFNKNKEGSKEKAKSKEKEKAKGTSEDSTVHASGHESPAERPDSRLSSAQSRASVSESYDSLSLDQSFSNTPSEPANHTGLKETPSPDNVVRKLFRKGSSSKFSLSSRLSKKTGPGSTTTVNSEKERRSSFCDSDDVGSGNGSTAAVDDVLGKSFDSTNSSPAIGSTKSKDGKMSGRWFSMGKKKERTRESLEVERERNHSIDTEATTEE